MIPRGHSAEMYVYVCVNVPVVESVHITYWAIVYDIS